MCYYFKPARSAFLSSLKLYKQDCAVPALYQQRHPFFDIQTRWGNLHSNSCYVGENSTPLWIPSDLYNLD